ncbi:lipoprotein insertase outer membrane protein LolB [Alishewanella sp. SMS8]|uniref:lipoprotein insertase outer membrane protein LolB n=1 Tax=unclassified Alishewanella TaxID=2628974 RepID=UPI002742174B|nr:lipoprotein insertase outer membrane protein LolB [Alishewanella sp. SMS8]MDP4944035.1 lipoprotein insertase outer membrane protein LolB [Alishewanella sp.]MDP5035473.1 lipoprotein insertase outer membrane protein LolB [Alishewanella sp.]MDP5187540.1 lipoprotein insertase outer membrane protein LolB [Alishewanella sp.]MDP5458473.1 lipoprotein insertase outer membrane protein LolB [Alishewanella sp. SMS8]
MSLPNSRWSMLVFVALLSACGLKPKAPPAEPVMNAAARQQQLNAMQSFTVQASMGIKAPNESISGNLRWQQMNANDFQARLANMLGISLFELTQQTNFSELLVKGERYQAADASSLLWQLAGWSIPLHDMPLWLRGLPGASATELQYDAAGRLTRFTLQDSTGIRWQLTYRSFFADALSLPKQLELSSDDTHIRLVIRSWQP